MFHHVFCIDRKETIHTFFFKKRTMRFFSPAFTIFISSLILALLNLFLKNLPFFSKELKTVFVHVIIKVNVFVQKNIHHILKGTVMQI